MQDPNKYIKKYTGTNSVSKKTFDIEVGYERFLGPEIFVHPEFANPGNLKNYTGSGSERRIGSFQEGQNIIINLIQ